MMKLRNIFSGLIVIFFALILNLTTSFAQTNYIYWTDVGTNKIQRANLNGTNIETLVRNVRAWDLASDIPNDKMYWVELESGLVRRSNLDGSNIEILVTGQHITQGIALDLDARKMYWTWSDDVTGKIRRANLDGTNIENLIDGLREPDSIALDVPSRKVYWTDAGTDTIQRANLNGTNIENLVTTGLSHPQGLSLNLEAGKMYWTNWSPLDAIHCANLDGSNVELLIRGSGQHGFEGLALDIKAGKMYWTNFDTDKILRANLDGTNIENLVTTGLNLPIGITLSIPQSSTRVPSRVNLNFAMPSEVSVGEELTATLNITNAVDLAGLQLDLHFNPIVLEVKDIQEGDLLAGTGTFFQVLHLATVPGEISGIRIARIGGVDGSGTLLKVVFKAKGVGVSELAAQNLRVGTSAGTAIPANVVSGKVEVGSRPDVTGDGKVNILDLVLVSRHFGPAAAAPPGVDINGDGQVDILDIIVLAQHLSTANTSTAPALLIEKTGLDAVTVQDWLATAYVENDGSLAFARGIANLEALLARIVPTETAVYANYPNPFNPETWLPYQLADAADVTFHIYSASGHLVRTLGLGHQAAGLYQSRHRAAYWDGRDAFGESVASGVYFYTLMAGDFTATRKMLVRK